ncbi:MAG: hypothetical protein R3300_17950, partial [Candidatus Promineifilaceae bacterium]|nr:hypothetical protein [Candidatus Promineifilaceae bacterium]
AAFGPYALLRARATRCEGQLLLESEWQPRRSTPVTPTTTLFSQALDDSGRLVAQADGPPLGLRPTLIQMTAGWWLADRRHLAPVVAEGGPAATTVLLGVYDFASGQRYPAVDAQGQSLPDEALRLPIAPCDR